MAKCQICGKKSSVGRTNKHRRGVASRKFVHRAPKKSKTFRPNIQKTTFRIGGIKLTLQLCTHCLKKMRQGKIAVPKDVNLKAVAAKKASDKPKKTEKK